MGDALYEIKPMRRFARLDPGDDALPDEAMILEFHRLLETRGPVGRLLETVNALLGHPGLLLRQGAIVDATIIHAPSSTKNKDGKCDSGMHQTKKGNQYFFGMKAHIGVDVESSQVHTPTTTPANETDATQPSARCTARKRACGRCRLPRREQARRPGRTSLEMAYRPLREATRYVEYFRAAVRAKVERPFRHLAGC